MADLLIVEDDPDCVELLTLHLTRRGHAVAAAPDGALALERIGKAPPDAALVDARIPRVDGVRLVEILRRDPLTRDLPVLMMSAADRAWTAHRLSEDPRVRYIEKPLDFDRLDALLAVLLALA